MTTEATVIYDSMECYTAENEIDAVEDARELYEDSVTFVNTNEESIFIEERHEGVDIKEV